MNSGSRVILISIFLIIFAVVIPILFMSVFAAHPSEPEPSPITITLTPTPTPISTPTPITTPTIPPKQNLSVHYIDVGQGDSILIKTPNNSTMMIDASTKDKSDTIKEYLNSNKITYLNYTVVTHAHTDHYGGMEEVAKSFATSFSDSGQTTTAKSYQSLLTTLSDRNIKRISAKRNDEINIDPSVKIYVLNPGLTKYSETNDNSVVIRIVYDNTSFLFMGDAGFAAENQMLLYGVYLDSDVLKVGHHGSSTSSSLPFLYAVSPTDSIISVGNGNSYGHPTPEALQRLSLAGSNVYRTDIYGTIIATSNGESYSIVTERGGRPGAAKVAAPDTPAGKEQTYMYNYDGMAGNITFYVRDDYNEYFSGKSHTYFELLESSDDVVTDLFEDKKQDEYLKSFVDSIRLESDTVGEQARIAISLIQHIKYGHVSEDPYDWRYPYETVYNNMGVCSDKSLLAAYVLSDLGYDVVYMKFESIHHAAFGVRCGPEYDFYDTGYAFIEMTKPFIPTDDTGEYNEGNDRITNNFTMVKIGDGKNSLDISEEYTDARAYIELFNVSGGYTGNLSHDQYTLWKTTVEKYDLLFE